MDERVVCRCRPGVSLALLTLHPAHAGGWCHAGPGGDPGRRVAAARLRGLRALHAVRRPRLLHHRPPAHPSGRRAQVGAAPTRVHTHRHCLLVFFHPVQRLTPHSLGRATPLLAAPGAGGGSEKKKEEEDELPPWPVETDRLLFVLHTFIRKVNPQASCFLMVALTAHRCLPGCCSCEQTVSVNLLLSLCCRCCCCYCWLL